MSFNSQLIGFIKRNFILKYRNKLQTLPEIYTPILILIALVIFNYVFEYQTLKAEVFQDEEFPFKFNISLNSYLYISPNDTQTQMIGNDIKNYMNFHYIRFFNTSSALKERYAKDAENYNHTFAFGLDFTKTNYNMSVFDYKIFTEWTSELFDGSQVKLFSDSDMCRKNDEILNFAYNKCAGNKYVYNGLSSLKLYIDYLLKKVRF